MPRLSSLARIWLRARSLGRHGARRDRGLRSLYPSRKAPRAGTVRHEATEQASIACDHVVGGLESGVGKRGEQTRRPTSPSHRAEQRDAAPSAPDEPPVPENQVPGREAFVGAKRGKEVTRVRIVHRQECELLAAVERGDDPRRPATEASAPVVEQDRSAELVHYESAASSVGR
jgi:hypothetical protein